MKYNIDDTIAAISTPVGENGIGIVRLSGPDSLVIADKIFKPKNGKCPSQFKTYTTHYGHILDKDKASSAIDEVILTIMRAPRSYTKEDIVEINCHGGTASLKKILECVLTLGARLAEPGEFTKRAFLNGRIDLAQAEGVLDIIRSKTDTSLRAAMSQVKGEFSVEVKNLRNELLDILSSVEASIDFPDEDIEILSETNFDKRVGEVIGKLKALIDSADKGKILREGITTVICGRPNVGKSSLMNALLKEKRVIVSHIPGTTRDTIEEIVNIGGIPLRLIDTAGIIDSEDILIKEGVERSRLHIKAADLIIFMVDGSEDLKQEDKKIADSIKDKKVVVVINKIDLTNKLKRDDLKKIISERSIIEISVAKKKNIDELIDKTCDMIWGGQITADHTPLVTNIRHKVLLIQAKDRLSNMLSNAKDTSTEFIALDMKEAIESLGEITGETIDTEILDRIFANFCIGK